MSFRAPVGGQKGSQPLWFGVGSDAAQPHGARNCIQPVQCASALRGCPCGAQIPPECPWFFLGKGQYCHPHVFPGGLGPCSLSQPRKPPTPGHTEMGTLRWPQQQGSEQNPLQFSASLQSCWSHCPCSEASPHCTAGETEAQGVGSWCWAALSELREAGLWFGAAECETRPHRSATSWGDSARCRQMLVPSKTRHPSVGGSVPGAAL